MGCVVEVVTKIRSGIEGKEILRKKYAMDADETSMSQLCRELKFRLNISGLHTRLKHPTEAHPWYQMITPKSTSSYFEWRFLTGEEADFAQNEFYAKDWRGKRGL